MSKHLGKTYGPYTVIELDHTEHHITPSGKTCYIQWFKVRCVCGLKKVCRLQNFQHVKSCPHGPSIAEQPNHQLFRGMHDRCTNPNIKSFKYYGARGIKVCDRWALTPQGLANFNADMGPRPSPLHTVDRKNPYDDYRPDNCRWATTVEQATNKRYKMSPRVGLKPPRKKVVFRPETIKARAAARLRAERETKKVRKLLDAE